MLNRTEQNRHFACYVRIERWKFSENVANAPSNSFVTVLGNLGVYLTRGGGEGWEGAISFVRSSVC